MECSSAGGIFPRCTGMLFLVERGLALRLATEDRPFLRAEVPGHYRPSVRREMSSRGKRFLRGTWPSRRELSTNGDAWLTCIP